jgi:hypothetical protein
MDTVTVEVRHRLVGGSRGDAPVPVVLELQSAEVTVADLIRQAVTEQIGVLQAVAGLQADQIRRVLDRQYLTRADLDDRGRDGTTCGPECDLSRSGDLDVTLEAERALHGFLVRAYAMLVNGRQVEHLDEVIALKPANRVTFLRLMAFSGG